MKSSEYDINKIQKKEADLLSFTGILVRNKGTKGKRFLIFIMLQLVFSLLQNAGKNGFKK
jgi:hypothetical protein